jgi:hypothetical protein
MKSFDEKEVKPMRMDEHTAAFISAPCHSFNDFTIKLGAIASIFELEVALIRKHLKHYEDDWKGFKLLKQLFEEKEVFDERLKGACEFVNRILVLRSKLPPFHHPSMDEAQKIIRELGLKFPARSMTEWQENGEILLQKLLGALRIMREYIVKFATK